MVCCGMYGMVGFGCDMRCDGADGLAGLSILHRCMTALCAGRALVMIVARLVGAVWECRWMLPSATRLFVWCFDLA